MLYIYFKIAFIEATKQKPIGSLKRCLTYKSKPNKSNELANPYASPTQMTTFLHHDHFKRPIVDDIGWYHRLLDPNMGLPAEVRTGGD